MRRGEVLGEQPAGSSPFTCIAIPSKSQARSAGTIPSAGDRRYRIVQQYIVRDGRPTMYQPWWKSPCLPIIRETRGTSKRNLRNSNHYEFGQITVNEAMLIVEFGSLFEPFPRFGVMSGHDCCTIEFPKILHSLNRFYRLTRIPHQTR